MAEARQRLTVSPDSTTIDPDGIDSQFADQVRFETLKENVAKHLKYSDSLNATLIADLRAYYVALRLQYQHDFKKYFSDLAFKKEIF